MVQISNAHHSKSGAVSLSSLTATRHRRYSSAKPSGTFLLFGILVVVVLVMLIWFMTLATMTSFDNLPPLNVHDSKKNMVQLQDSAIWDPWNHKPNKQAPDAADKELCAPYYSMYDLTDLELQPIRDKTRYMKTPPSTGGTDVSLVCCNTTVGPLAIAVHSAWAPLGAKRFLDMVTSGYFNVDQGRQDVTTTTTTAVPLMRCVRNFLCQFGISSYVDRNLGPNKAPPGAPFTNFTKSIPDDHNWVPKGPNNRENSMGVKRFAKGFLAYAGGGNHSRTKQLILALHNDGHLSGGSPWEVPFGEVLMTQTDRFEQTIDAIYTGYGEKGPPQGRLGREGWSTAMQEEFPKLDHITQCQLLDHTTLPHTEFDELH